MGRGAPDALIEVSPTNTAAEIREKETLCLENGSLEFWAVDLTRRQVTVTRKGEWKSVFSSGDRIPLDRFGGEALAVADLFSGMR